ncbi:MAG: hypothetical protein A2162_05985 [Deltaproteobacteria bacterium RBG_13_52_11b]|nr:MAG: hypothetical protein A2162_05985 [Deltaproteobacteria bacterium RBG_13_52_11b]
MLSRMIKNDPACRVAGRCTLSFAKSCSRGRPKPFLTRKMIAARRRGTPQLGVFQQPARKEG